VRKRARIVARRTAPAERPHPAAAARAAGLQYVSDHGPGIRRRRAGAGFVYAAPSGSRIRAAAELVRIRALAVPPAWKDVWICPDASGHIQATGRDARGRKQYRYHPRWRAFRDDHKYERLSAIGQVLPAVRGRVDRDLARPGLPREKVLALMVRLLESTLIRVGNAEYARENRSFGLTTLRATHLDVSGSRLRFRFRGKSGKDHSVGLQDPRLSRILRRCQELPGQELFRYLDAGGQPRRIGSGDVNHYLRGVARCELTAKDFRTWGATMRAAWALRELPPPRSKADGKRNVTRAIEEVSRRLGNTVSTCRRCYVHPAVVEAYLEGSLHSALRRARRSNGGSRLRPHESAVLAFLARRAPARERPAA
jgi:DNA topoisomerase-1